MSVDESSAGQAKQHRGRKTVLRGERARLIVATGLGLGLSPLAPGSLAALFAVAIDVAVSLALPGSAQRFVLAGALLAVCVLHWRLTPWAVHHWRNRDPRQFVLDEVAGYLLVAVLFRAPPHGMRVVAGFLLFRILDAVKLPPARRVDRRMHGALGIVLDDFIAAVYTALLLFVGWWAWHAFGPG